MFFKGIELDLKILLIWFQETLNGNLLYFSYNLVIQQHIQDKMNEQMNNFQDILYIVNVNSIII